MLQNTELTIGITEKTMGSVGDGSQAELAAHSWGEDRSVETQWQKKDKDDDDDDGIWLFLLLICFYDYYFF